jgi:hypothetical protein
MHIWLFLDFSRDDYVQLVVCVVSALMNTVRVIGSGEVLSLMSICSWSCCGFSIEEHMHLVVVLRVHSDGCGVVPALISKFRWLWYGFSTDEYM